MNKTYGELKTFVENRLDLLDEDFVTASEFLESTEIALKYVEAEIHKLGVEDEYFEAHAPITMVTGRSDYALPSNIYANKIKRLIYSYGGDIFPVSRMRRKTRYEAGEVERYYNSSTKSFQYRVVNLDPRVGTKIRLFPPAKESTTTVSTTGTVVSGSTALSLLGTTTGVSAGWLSRAPGSPPGPGLRALTHLRPSPLPMRPTPLAPEFL
jgi:hypothetical protein